MTPAARHRLGALVILAAIVVVVVAVALVSRGAGPIVLNFSPSALSLNGAQILSGYSGDIETGTSFTAVAEDLGLKAAETPSVSAPSAILMSEDAGRVLYSHNPDERRAMASTTKIMTALLVLEKLPLQSQVTVSAKAEATDESQILLEEGEILTVEELLYGLLVGSANDAAVALAEAVSGSVDAFVAEMNQKAAELGLANTHYANPHGLDAPEHYSSARDLAVLARCAMADERFRKLAGTWKCTIPGSSGGSSRSLTNHNLLLGELDWVTGVKTGFTDDAGFCLVASGESDSVSMISVVLGESSKDACWSESEALLSYGFTQISHLTLVTQGTAVAEAGIPYVTGESVQLVTEEPVEADLAEGDEITGIVRVDDDLQLPVEGGQRFGELTLAMGGETLTTTALVTDRACSKPTLRSKLAYVWNRLFH